MPTKTTRIESRKDENGKIVAYEIVSIATGEQLYVCFSMEEATRWQTEYESRKTFASAHLFIDGDKITEVKGGEYNYNVTADHLSKPMPYFGDPSKPFSETSGGIEPVFTDRLLRVDFNKLRDMMGTPVNLKDELRKVSIRELINAVIWQMADKEGYDSVFVPTEDQFQNLCNHIFDNYVAKQNPQAQAPNNRTIDPKVMNSHLTTLVNKLQVYDGIKLARLIFEDYPDKATVVVHIDPAFEFESQEHVEDWEANMALLIKRNKPKQLKDLEIIFNRTEVF